jgi:hypothetical protein
MHTHTCVNAHACVPPLSLVCQFLFAPALVTTRDPLSCRLLPQRPSNTGPFCSHLLRRSRHVRAAHRLRSLRALSCLCLRAQAVLMPMAFRLVAAARASCAPRTHSNCRWRYLHSASLLPSLAPTYINPLPPTEAWTASLGLPATEAWRPWLFDDGQVAGYVKSYQGVDDQS